MIIKGAATNMENFDKNTLCPAIAVCISGAPRFETIAIEYLLKSLSSYSRCDIFVAVWQTPRFNEIMIRKKLLGLTSNNIRVASIEFLEEPKVVAEHEYVKFPPTKVENVYKMYCGIQMCAALVAEYAATKNRHYDYIVRCRSDIVLNKTFDFSVYAEVLKDHLVMPCNGWGIYNANDQFAVANPQLMDVYTSLYNHITSYTTLPDPGVLMHPETLLGAHLLKNGVKVYQDDLKSLVLKD